MPGAEAPDQQARDSVGIKALQLLGEAADRLDPPQLRGRLDQLEERLGPDAAQRAVALGSQHPHPALLVRVIDDQQQRRGTPALSFFPCSTNLPLVTRNRLSKLNAVDDPALGQAVARPRIPAARDRRNAIE